MSLAGTFRRLAHHRYTRVATVSIEADETGYFEESEVVDTETPDQVCLYVAAGTVTETALGRTQAIQGEVHVLPTDPIQAGDLVRDIRSTDGVVLLEGPRRVARIEEHAGFGVAIKRVAYLAGAEVAS